MGGNVLSSELACEARSTQNNQIVGSWTFGSHNENSFYIRKQHYEIQREQADSGQQLAKEKDLYSV